MWPGHPLNNAALAILLAVILVLLVAPGSAAGQSTTYYLGGGALDNANPFVEPCAVPICRTLTTAAPSGYVTLSAPLPANMGPTNVAGVVTSFQISAGGLTISSAGDLDRLPFLVVATGATGEISNFQLEVQGLRSLTYGLGDTDPNARIDLIGMMNASVIVWVNFYCTARTGDGTCINRFADDSSSTANGSSPNALSLTPPIPTLSEWAMILLAMLVGGRGAMVAARRRLGPAT